MARFRLAQTEPESSSDAVVGAYLAAFPGDRDVAVRWLDGILSGGAVTPGAHDIAARIGSVHGEDAAVQRMLAQFYLAERRCDFAALKTYRQVVDAGQPLPAELIGDLADLFLSQPRADDLALTVYVDAYARGGRDTRLLPGIAACCRMIRPGPLTLPLLEKADKALAGFDASRRAAMAADFLPPSAEAAPSLPARRRRINRQGIWPTIRKALAGLGRQASRLAAGFYGWWRKLRAGLGSRQARSALKWSAMGLFTIALGWLVVSTATHLADTIQPVEKAPVPVDVPVTDPFTLQVAAYVKETDARRYVAQLKGQGLDAYWTRASGSSKTWYQVRVSHFATKAEARVVGEDLKKQQLIGDYYVANYKRPDVP
jgi:hypothetical protein